MQKRTPIVFAAVAATLTLATACDQKDPTSPLTEPGQISKALAVPLGTTFTAPATPTAGQVTVCKTAASHETYQVPGTATFTYDVTVSYPSGHFQAQDQVDSTVTLSPGQCATVFYRPNPSSPTGGTEYEALVSITERSQDGYSLQNLTIDQTSPSGSANGFPAISGSTAQMMGNYYHGYVVNYTNQTSGISIGGNPEPPPTGEGCVLSQGYYKTHLSAISAILSAPVNTTTTYLSSGMLVIGGEPALTSSNIVDYLSRPTKGNVRISVERQLIAAELNILSGASATTTITNEITEANTILASSSLTQSQITRLHQIESDLDAFNNGTTGITGNALHCDD